MAVVRMVQMAFHEVIHVVAMRHGFVSAVRPVLVAGFVRGAGVAAGAGRRILGRHVNHVLVIMPVVRMMQVAVVEIIHVVAVLHGVVPAAGRVLVRVIAMGLASHVLTFSFCGFDGRDRPFARVRQGIENQIGDVLVSQAVEDVLPFPAPGDQVRLVQNAEPLADGGQAVMLGSGEFGDAGFALREHGEQAEALNVAEGFEDALGLFQRRVVDLRPPGGPVGVVSGGAGGGGGLLHFNTY